MRGLARLMVEREAERIWLALYGMEKVSVGKRLARIKP
jgi:hypothetical protein